MAKRAPADAQAHARWSRRVKYISKYISQKGENKVKRCLRHISVALI
jgi:hypothetical protein